MLQMLQMLQMPARGNPNHHLQLLLLLRRCLREARRCWMPMPMVMVTVTVPMDLVTLRWTC